MINRDNINAKRERIINLLDETIINKTDKKKNDDIKFKQKEKIIINFEIVTTTNENEIIIKKTTIKNNDFYIFEIFDVKNSIERISMKFVVDHTTTFLNIFKNSLFNFKKFLK